MKSSVWALILMPVIVYLCELFMKKLPDGKFKRFLLFNCDSIYVTGGITAICIVAVAYGGYIVLS